MSETGTAAAPGGLSAPWLSCPPPSSLRAANYFFGHSPLLQKLLDALSCLFDDPHPQKNWQLSRGGAREVQTKFPSNSLITNCHLESEFITY